MVYANCPAVQYVDFKFYFVVDVIEKADEAHLKYGPAPQETITLANAEILDLKSVSLLADPDEVVRNNISRFAMAFVDRTDSRYFS